MALQAPAEFIKSLSEYVELNVSGKLNLQKAILFGSFAKETQHKHSDIDIALISPDYRECDYLNESVRAMDIFEGFDSRVEPHLFSPEEMLTDDIFVNEIKKTGIVIYQR